MCGFDISLDIPSGVHPSYAPFIRLSLGDPYHGRLIRRSANLAIQRCNAKMGKSLLLVEVLKANFAPAWGKYYLTLRAIDRSTLQIKTYQTRVLNMCYDDFFEEDVETFMPLPEVTPAPPNPESSAESQDLKRPRIMLDQYIACSVCEKELSDVLVEHNRRFKVDGTLCEGPVRLDHPYHRCRIKQCAKAALAEYNTREDLNLPLFEVLNAELSNFESNKLQYLIEFRCATHLPCPTVLKAECLCDDDRHDEIVVKDLAPVLVDKKEISWDLEL
ncbi:hypothetical protein Tsubulata_027582 [Turnera subulata]|uniref:Cystatin domain-containing protein n=1 Tax=Turnera subulata TaxID=218843 RepID=A0A9Q0JH95_9ROSI|nr:hypothetical protein Tsubulata_027582 [Turnera subulata]